MQWTLEQRRSVGHPISVLFVRVENGWLLMTGEVIVTACANEFDMYNYVRGG